MKTNLSKVVGSLAAVAIAILMASSASAGPHDAGWKARGMRDDVSHGSIRYYSAPAMSSAGRQSFSYEPATAAPRAAAAAPAPQANSGYRTYTYQPAPVRSYSARRLSQDATHFGGNYSSKATLYNQ